MHLRLILVIASVSVAFVMGALAVSGSADGAAPSQCAQADLNEDGEVNGQDIGPLMQLVRLFRNDDAYTAQGDLNQDNSVDLADFTVLLTDLYLGGGCQGTTPG